MKTRSWDRFKMFLLVITLVSLTVILTGCTKKHDLDGTLKVNHGSDGRCTLYEFKYRDRDDVVYHAVLTCVGEKPAVLEQNLTTGKVTILKS